MTFSFLVAYFKDVMAVSTSSCCVLVLQWHSFSIFFHVNLNKTRIRVFSWTNGWQLLCCGFFVARFSMTWYNGVFIIQYILQNPTWYSYAYTSAKVSLPEKLTFTSKCKYTFMLLILKMTPHSAARTLMFRRY